jgi:hypothetical protein
MSHVSSGTPSVNEGRSRAPSSPSLSFPSPPRETVAVELRAIWDELARVAARIGVEIREERLEPVLEGRDHGRGGLCVVRGRRVVLLDERAPLRDRVATLALALGGFDLESVHVSPLVRSTIERGGRVAAPRPPSANEPGTRVPPPEGSAWVRVGVAVAANDEFTRRIR